MPYRNDGEARVAELEHLYARETELRDQIYTLERRLKQLELVNWLFGVGDNARTYDEPNVYVLQGWMGKLVVHQALMLRDVRKRNKQLEASNRKMLNTIQEMLGFQHMEEDDDV